MDPWLQLKGRAIFFRDFGVNALGGFVIRAVRAGRSGSMSLTVQDKDFACVPFMSRVEEGTDVTFLLGLRRVKEMPSRSDDINRSPSLSPIPRQARSKWQFVALDCISFLLIGWRARSSRLVSM